MIGIATARLAAKPAALLLAALLQVSAPAAPQPTPKPAMQLSSFQQTVHQAIQQALAEAAAQQAPGQSGNPNQLTPAQQYEIAREGNEIARTALEHRAGTFGALVPFGFFAMIILIVWLGTRRRQAQIRAQAELRKQLIDKFGTGPELAAFLESKGGRQFFADMQPPGGPLRFLPSGIVVSMIGLALLGLTVIHRPFIVPGVILLATGVGLLLSAAIGHKVAARGAGGEGPGSASGVPSLPRA